MFRRLGVPPTLYGLHHFLPPPAPHPLHPHPTLTPSLGLVGVTGLFLGPPNWLAGAAQLGMVVDVIILIRQRGVAWLDRYN